MGWDGHAVRRARAAVIDAYGIVCHLCGLPCRRDVGYLHPLFMTVDHVLPRSLGGTDDLANLRPAHRRCNLQRGARPSAAVRRAESAPVSSEATPRQTRPHLPSPPKTPQKNGETAE